MRIEIPNLRMKEKLERLLLDVPGEFRHHPQIITGYEQLRVFRKSGVLCPDFTVHLEEAQKWVAAGISVFGRTKAHEKGRDIVDQHSPAWPTKEFWIKVIPDVSREYRVHIFDNKHIQQGLKWLDPTAVKQRIDGLPIRNTETGWKYDHLFAPPDGAVELAKKAVLALQYLWGAVDCLEDKSGNYYVLEVNSAPGMDDITATAHADAIKAYASKGSKCSA